MLRQINIIEIDVTMHKVISCKNSFFHSNRSADSATSYRENIICFLNKENYVALRFKSIILCGGKDFQKIQYNDVRQQKEISHGHSFVVG